MSLNLYRIAAVGCCLTAIGVAFYPLLPKAWASNHLLKVPAIVELGEVDSLVRFEIPVENSSGETVEILGAMTGCGCIFPKNLPLTVESGAAKQLEIEFKPDKADTAGKQHLALSIQLLTNTEEAPLPTTVNVTVITHESGANTNLAPIPSGVADVER